MIRSLLSLACVSTMLAAAPALLSGCAGNKGRLPDTNFHVRASNTDIVAGDTVTITTSSQNTAGYHPAVTWTSSGGRVKPEDNGNIARATFDHPGDYTVTAHLSLDGRAAGHDSVRIHVRPVK